MKAADPNKLQYEREESANQRLAAAARHDDWQRRWVYSLSLGNGGGLLAVSTALLDPEKASPFLLLSGLFYFAGLLSAAIIPYYRSVEFQHSEDYWWGKERETYGPFTISYDQTGETFTHNQKAERNLLLRRNAIRTQLRYQGVAVGAFIAATGTGFIAAGLKLFNLV